MSAKEYLEQYKLADIKLEQKKEQYETLRLKVSSAGGIDYSKERVQTSVQGDSLSKIVTEYTLLEQEIKIEMRTIEQIKNTVINDIQLLKNPNHVSVLYLKYIDYRRYGKLKAIAGKLEYSYDYVRELHRGALQELEKLLQEKL